MQGGVLSVVFVAVVDVVRAERGRGEESVWYGVLVCGLRLDGWMDGWGWDS
jgi:hypothetical protein